MNILDMVLICEIHPQDVKVDSRQVGQPGKERTLRTQCGYFKKPSRIYPEFFKFTLPDSQVEPYPAGRYIVHPDSFETDGYDGLQLSRFNFRLIPLPKEAVK